jgi:hypothetical protein
MSFINKMQIDSLLQPLHYCNLEIVCFIPHSFICRVLNGRCRSAPVGFAMSDCPHTAIRKQNGFSLILLLRSLRKYEFMSRHRNAEQNHYIKRLTDRLIWLRGGLLWPRQWTFWFYRMLRISWVAELLAASQEGPSSLVREFTNCWCFPNFVESDILGGHVTLRSTCSVTPISSVSRWIFPERQILEQKRETEHTLYTVYALQFSVRNGTRRKCFVTRAC